MTRPMLALALAPVPPFAIWAAGQPLTVLVWLGVALLSVDLAAGYAWWTMRRERTPLRPVVVALDEYRRGPVAHAESARQPIGDTGPMAHRV